MANNTISALDEQFKEECKTLNLVYEYPGYTGTVRWAIITGLTTEQLFEKYPEQIRPYVPFMILSLSQGEVIHAFNRNEDKFGKRHFLPLPPKEGHLPSA